MKLVPQETSLVIAGAWNPAILTPEWMINFGLKKAADGTNRVQALIPAGAGLLFDVPRYKIENMQYSVRPDSLVLLPAQTTPENLASIEMVAANILEQLAHTPVAGIGHNFEFRDANPDPRFLTVFTRAYQDLVDIAPTDWNIASSAIYCSFSNDQVSVNIQRYFDGASLVVKFNFHHPISSVTQGLDALRREGGYSGINANFDLAKGLITRMYGVIEENAE